MTEHLPLIFDILSVVGGSSLLAALLPLKFRKWMPLISKLIDLAAANVGSAQNKAPQDIEVDRMIDRNNKAIRIAKEQREKRRRAGGRK